MLLRFPYEGEVLLSEWGSGGAEYSVGTAENTAQLNPELQELCEDGSTNWDFKCSYYWSYHVWFLELIRWQGRWQFSGKHGSPSEHLVSV